MRKIYLITVLALFTVTAFGQAVGDFRTFGTGQWNNVNTWSRFDGAIWVNPAPNTPTNADGVITIQAAHNVTIPSGFSVTVDQVIVVASNTAIITIAAGGTMVLNGTGTDLTFNGGLQRGRVLVSGTLIVNEGATIVNSANTRLFIQAGGVYQHNYTTSAGTIYTADWAVGSTLEFIGYTSNAAAPGGLNQPFRNVTWNCPNQAIEVDLNGALLDVNGNLTISNTGSLGNYLILSDATGFTLNIDGNFSVTNSANFTITAFSAITANVNVAGNFDFTSDGYSYLAFTGDANLDVNGTFSMNTSGVLDMSGDAGDGSILAAGNMTITAGTIASSGSGDASVIFNGTAVQTFASSGAIIDDVDFTVLNLSIVDFGTSAITGLGDFNLNSGGSIRLGSLHASGAIQTGQTAGNIRVGGTRTYSAGGNLIYNGAGAQTIGNGFPTTAVNLEINNSSGVTNNNNGTTNVIGNLTLTAGPFVIGNNNTLNVQSNLSIASGTIGGGATSSLTFSGAGTLSGSLTFQSGAEQLNNFTLARSTNIPLGSNLNINGILAFSSTGNLDISGRVLTIQGNNGDITQSGSGGIVSNSSSSLIFNATDAITEIPFSGGPQLGTLTFNNSGTATYTLNTSVTVTGTLNLNSGTLTHSSGLTMGAGSTFVRNSGSSIASNAPTAASSYNLTYNGTLTTGLELPSVASALNNLNVSGNVTADKSFTVNGALALNSGTFNGSTFTVTVAGSSIAANGGTYTSTGTTVFSIAGSTALSGSTISGIQFNDLTINSGATLVAPGGTINVAGNWDNNGGFTHSGGTVAFNGAAQIIASNNVAFNNVTISGSSSKVLSEGLNVDNTLTISSTLSPLGQTVSIAGSWINNGTFNAATSTVVFDGTTTISGSSATNFAHVSITGTLTSPSSFNVAGNFSKTGTFNAGTGTVNFNGTVISQSITGSSTTFNNVTVSNPVGVNVNATARLNGVFTLSGSGVFDADGSGSGVFIVSSSSQSDGGMIAPLTTPANFGGAVTVERFIHSQAGGDYRYLAIPITNGNVSMLKNSIFVTGNFSDRSTNADNSNIVDSGNTNASVFTYNSSTQAYDDVTGGGGTTASTALSNALGYSAYNFNDGSVTASFRGTIGKGSVPVTISSVNGNFNLVPNPYPSPIDWDNVTKTNVNNAMYLRVNNNVFSSYVGGIATNAPFGGWTGEVATGQSFFTTSNGVGSTLTFAESNKTTNSYSFLRTNSVENYFRVVLSSEAGQRDEVVIHFAKGATDDFDTDYDATKLRNGNYVSPVLGTSKHLNLATFFPNTAPEFSINTMDILTGPKIVNLNVSEVDPGLHTLSFTELSALALGYNIVLVDNYLNKEYEVSDEFAHDFEVKTDPASYGDSRFHLRINGTGVVTGDLPSTIAIGVYPNPVDDVLYIDLTPEQESMLKSISMVDILGNTVTSSDRNPQLLEGGRKSIQMAGQAAGVYVLSLHFGDSVKTLRVIKQ